MEQTESGKKLILAIIQEADYDMVVSALTEHSFYVTQLSSTGGFLKKRNVTIMIGVENERLEVVLDILKQYTGRRVQRTYTPTMPGGIPVPVDVRAGGATVLVLAVDSLAMYCANGPGRFRGRALCRLRGGGSLASFIPRSPPPAPAAA